ncbi:ferredoxin [Marivita sp. S0852]|uniref:ferredoxin n=1 Tax=Marivita sp. S0852 TaxID=3373893 RepID=UPI003982021E
MTLSEIDTAARDLGLAVRGAFHPDADDHAPKGAQTVVMLGPDEPGFWALFQASPEYADGADHPLDRWSKRVTTTLAAPWKATALFPYDGPPYAPFLRWAEKTGTHWPSPVGLLVHATAGLFVSFRSAIALPQRLKLSDSSVNPCLSCEDQPCRTACPVGALVPGKDYDVPACVAHIKSPAGADCRNGCLVRRSCPVSKCFGRVPEQSAFHMRAFLGD